MWFIIDPRGFIGAAVLCTALAECAADTVSCAAQCRHITSPGDEAYRQRAGWRFRGAKWLREGLMGDFQEIKKNEGSDSCKELCHVTHWPNPLCRSLMLEGPTTTHVRAQLSQRRFKRVNVLFLHSNCSCTRRRSIFNPALVLQCSSPQQ